MKIAVTVVTLVMALLSVAAGIAKITLVPDEVLFLTGFGFSESAIIIYGAIQTLGGILFVVPVSSIVGSVIVILAFSLSTLLLFLAGNVAFALLSLLPISLTALAMFYRIRVNPQATEADT